MRWRRRQAADVRLAAGETAPMLGLPIANKDLFCTKGQRTTAGSRILKPFVAPYESTVTANLLRDGAVSLGKTNLDEFAMGSSNMTSAFGAVTNPWTRADGAKLVPGGSSGGSAAAVAAGLALGATGTDTGGSIRQPAAFTGIVGIKPTYGRCSRWGVVAFASSLDQPGAFARGVEDAAVMLGSMAGFDPLDSTSAERAVPDFAAACARGVKGLRIGRAAGIPERGAGAGDRGVVGAGVWAGCASRGPRRWTCRCRTRSMGWRRTTSWRRRRRRRTSLGMTGFGTAPGWMGPTWWSCMSGRGRRGSGRRSGGGSWSGRMC